MPAPVELSKISVQQFTERFQQEMIPLGARLSYFAALPLSEEELRDYLEEPVNALPAGIAGAFQSILVFLVPYLEKTSPKADEVVTFQKPEAKIRVWGTQFASEGRAKLVFAIRDHEVAEYHYVFYRAIATLLADAVSHKAFESFADTLRDELRSGIHGEIDSEGWDLKQALVRRRGDQRHDSKAFRSYLRQALIDTMTLYLHGICCDIDVETGPRQLPSRILRRRLQLLHDAFPPPKGFAVFPEELNGA
jgi:hypothetical protein